ncbi:glycosyltransferase family 2 protein [Clostridium sardiniense]|uniref:glycosyltransferase family 2 protein n=1 Tax=Clostridium sardiniense TaxID=29369 RepID=UPI003D33B044
MPKVSIIIPIYNVEKYLKRCIKSVLNQTLQDFELILINDGSSDSSGEICDEYINIKNVIVIHKRNEGVSSARNKGINIAKGEFLTFIDPDDCIDEDALELLYNLAKDNDAEIACYSMKTYKNNILTTAPVKNYKTKIFKKEKILKEYIEKGTFLYSVCNKIYANKLFANNRNRFSEDINYAEDALFNCYIMNDTNKLVFTNKQKYNYFINDNSTVKYVTEKRLDVLKAQKAMYYFILNNHKEYTKHIIKQYVNSSIHIVIDISREDNIIKKKYILRKLKTIVNRDKEILKNIYYTNLKDKICFNMIKISPVSLTILYKIRFFMKNYNMEKC